MRNTAPNLSLWTLLLNSKTQSDIKHILSLFCFICCCCFPLSFILIITVIWASSLSFEWEKNTARWTTITSAGREWHCHLMSCLMTLTAVHNELKNKYINNTATVRHRLGLYVSFTKSQHRGTFAGQSQASWNTKTFEAFVLELHRGFTTMWNPLNSDTCWPTWLSHT